MNNNKTKSKEVIKLIKWNSAIYQISHMSFGSSFIRSNDLNTQKRPKHTKNSSLSYIEQDTSHSFPLPYDHRPPSTVFVYLTGSTRTATRPDLDLIDGLAKPSTVRLTAAFG